MFTKKTKYSLQKLASLLLVLTLMFTSLAFVSCNKNEIEYDEEEVLKAAEKLLKNAEIVNSVFYGNGIGYLEGGNQNGVYCEANYAHLYSFGFRSLSDMKTLCQDTYSEGISYMIFAATVDVSVDGSGNYLIARYYVPDKEPDRLMVNTNYKQIFDDKMTIDYTTLKIEGAEKDRIKLTVTASVYSLDESKTEPQTVILNVYLVEEMRGYRIDNFVFANYNDALN